MDMRQFKKPRLLKVDDVRSGPRQLRIAGVLQGKYEKPDLVFESGDKLGLSATNIDILAEAYGWDSNMWIGHVVELSVGKGQFSGKEVDMVLLKPISKAEVEGAETAKEPAKKKTPNKPPQLKAVGGGGAMDYEIPIRSGVARMKILFLGARIMRERLANRRFSELFLFEWNGMPFTATISRFDDDRLAEIFLGNGKIGSHADAASKNSAIVCSLALQHGVPLATIQDALLRNAHGVAESPLGTALDHLTVE